MAHEAIFDAAMLSRLWSELDPTHAERFEGELVREVADGHPLFGKQARAVAVRKLEKEVVFWLPAERRWVWVHLTWAQQTSPRWPTADFHETWESLVAALTEARRE